jgi:hypothetical protein
MTFLFSRVFQIIVTFRSRVACERKKKAPGERLGVKVTGLWVVGINPDA